MRKPTKSPTVPAPEPPYQLDWFDYSMAAILGLALTVAAIQKQRTPPTHEHFVSEDIVTEKVCPECKNGHLKYTGYSVSLVKRDASGETVDVGGNFFSHTCEECGDTLFLKQQRWPVHSTTLKPK